MNYVILKNYSLFLYKQSQAAITGFVWSENVGNVSTNNWAYYIYKIFFQHFYPYLYTSILQYISQM